ncbi:toxin-antitoxin system YwqK family antitoxin [Streptomyces sp. BH097]|uniref:toxin-antitoxin system YwqK family antitoxin n=1 Tax=unclassified Streptomyces TaxID=2593676 RepID=UPI003BB7759C
MDSEDTYTEDDNVIVHYEGEPYTGEVVSHDEEGQLIQLQTYVDGVSTGPYRRWWPDGSLRSEGKLSLEAHVGEWHSWHRNGQLAKRIFYTERGVDVSGRQWDKEGNLVQEYGTFPENADSPAPLGRK